MNVPNEGPCGGQIVVMLMFLKDYSNGDNLCGRCGVDQKKCKGFVPNFLDHLSDIDFVITIVCWIVGFLSLIFANIICLFHAIQRLISTIET